MSKKKQLRAPVITEQTELENGDFRLIFAGHHRLAQGAAFPIDEKFFVVVSVQSKYILTVREVKKPAEAEPAPVPKLGTRLRIAARVVFGRRPRA